MRTRNKEKTTDKQDEYNYSKDPNIDISQLIQGNTQSITVDEENAKAVAVALPNVDALTASDNEAIEGLNILCKTLWKKAHLDATKKIRPSKKRAQPKQRIVAKARESEEMPTTQTYPVTTPQPMLIYQQQPYISHMEYHNMMMYYNPMSEVRPMCVNLSQARINSPINFPKGGIHVAIAYHIYNKQHMEQNLKEE